MLDDAPKTLPVIDAGRANAPACSLDPAGLAQQRERYSRAGRAATVLERTSLRLVVQLGEDVPSAAVDALIAVERECCPFFELGWARERRRLTIAVRQPEHAPALEGIADALGLG